MRKPPEQQLLDDITKYGWHCLQILGDAGGPGYSYTVGLYKTHQHPELMIMGLPGPESHRILALAAEEIAKGQPFKEDTRHATLLEGHDCLLRGIPRSAYRDYLGMALWYYRDTPGSFPALQILWPDPEGRFPGQPGFTHGAVQPSLT